jgi:hypothetical protein
MTERIVTVVPDPDSIFPASSIRKVRSSISMKKQIRPKLAQSDNRREVTNQVTASQTTMKPGKQKLKDSNSPDAVKAPTERSSRFRVHAHIDLPVAVEVTIEARDAREAHRLTDRILEVPSIATELDQMIRLRRLSVPAGLGRQVDIQVESLLLHLPEKFLVWKIVDLDSRKSCGPKFTSLLYRPSSESRAQMPQCLDR